MTAKKKRKSQGGDGEIRIRVPGGTTPEETPDAESAEEEALEDALGELPQGTVAKLYRLEEDGTKSFVAQTAPESMTEERIARSGPGNYIVVFWGPLGDGTNRKGYKGRRQVKVAEGSKAFTGPVSNADGSPVNPMDALMQTQFIKFLEMQDRHRQVEMTLMERLANRPERDWTPIVAAVAPVLGGIVTALMNRKDPVEIAAEITKLQPESRQPDMFGMFKQVLEVVRDLTPDSDSGGGSRANAPWWEAPAERILTAVLQGAQQNGTVAAATGVPAVTENPPVALPPTTQGGDMVERLVRQHGATILQWAMEDRDPEWAAETLLYEVPRGLHRQIATRLETEPGIINAIIAMAPPFGEHRQWLEDLRDAIVNAIVEASEPDDEPTPRKKKKDANASSPPT